MSLSTNSTFNPILSEALNKIGENRFVGTQILPVREVGLKNGVFPVFGDAQFDNNASKTRSPGTLFGRRDFAYEQDSYSCLQYALEGVLPDEDETEANENGISDVTGALAQKLQRDLMVGHELRVASLMKSAGFNATNATDIMSDSATAKPIKDIQNAVERLNANGFYDNIQVVIESSVYNDMLNTDDVRNIFNGNGQYTSPEVLASAMGVSGFIICPTRYNSSAKGASASRSKIWATDEYYVGQISGGDFSSGGFARTLAFGQGGGVFTAETYRDEPIKSDVLRVYNTVDEKVINVNACERINNDNQ